jgi:hypothetical protein
VQRTVRRYATGVWGKVKKKREKIEEKKLLKSMTNIIFKNNTMIKILAIEF